MTVRNKNDLRMAGVCLKESWEVLWRAAKCEDDDIGWLQIVGNGFKVKSEQDVLVNIVKIFDQYCADVFEHVIGTEIPSNDHRFNFGIPSSEYFYLPSIVIWTLKEYFAKTILYFWFLSDVSLYRHNICLETYRLKITEFHYGNMYVLRTGWSF